METTNISDVFEAISNFYSSPTYALLKRRLLTVPFMETIGKSRSETCHSAFLHWFFHAPDLMQIVASPVASLLKLLAMRSKYDAALMDRELCRDILTDNLIVDNVCAEVEQSTKSDEGNGRADIVLDVYYRLKNHCSQCQQRLRIVIENKIDSKEGEKQCMKYHAHYSQKNDVAHTLYVFLAPSVVDQLSSPHFIQITYNDLVTKVIEPLMYDRVAISPRAHGYITNFLENITSLRNTNIHPQIAMDSELKKLLTDFYNNNQELILASIEAAADEETREVARKIRDHNAKDYTSYTLTYNGAGKNVVIEVKAKSKLAKSFVEAYCNVHPEASLSDMQRILSEVKNGVITDEERDRTYQIDGKDWYIDAGIWGKGHKYLDTLLKVIRKNGFEITEIEQ
ncbi:MAG: PD-(D/E)XK nuclease family protein [Muribaculaceae bacterium]|nr:PD-(D/E)XK nuclease family protein [Muribaculaceae bacterium]